MAKCRCVICCMAYKNREILITLPCQHQYHSKCITEWLRINKVTPHSYLVFVVSALACPLILLGPSGDTLNLTAGLMVLQVLLTVNLVGSWKSVLSTHTTGSSRYTLNFQPTCSFWHLQSKCFQSIFEFEELLFSTFSVISIHFVSRKCLFLTINDSKCYTYTTVSEPGMPRVHRGGIWILMGWSTWSCF